MDFLTIIKDNQSEFLIIILIILAVVAYCIYPLYGYTVSLVALVISFLIDLYKNNQIKSLETENKSKDKENLKNKIEINITKLEDLKKSHKLFHYTRPIDTTLKTITIPDINLEEKLKTVEIIKDTTDDINRLIAQRKTITASLKKHPSSKIISGRDPFYSAWYDLETDLKNKIDNLIEKSKELQNIE